MPIPPNIEVETIIVMKLRNLSFLAVLAALLVFTSCGDDDDVTTVADAAGTYSYTINYTLIADRNISIPSESGTLTVETSGGGLRFVFDSNTILDDMQTSGTEIASNGVAFNFQSYQDTDTDGDQFTISGVNLFEIEGGGDYHGFYDLGSMQIEAELLLDYTSAEFDEFNLEIELLANRN
jgi:hypothetical protein